MSWPETEVSKDLRMVQLCKLIKGKAALWLIGLNYTEADHDLAWQRLDAKYGDTSMEKYKIVDSWNKLPTANSFRTLNFLYFQALSIVQKMKSIVEEVNSTATF